ncbi:hypothetical protein BBP40_000915 [Aspergillus hancockii]|nr:hypothetical protein BBP40_000915 [Aspergillus hancockii]
MPRSFESEKVSDLVKDTVGSVSLSQIDLTASCEYAPHAGQSVMFLIPDTTRPTEGCSKQKKFMKFGLPQSALESNVSLIENEVQDYLDTSPNFQGTSGVVDICAAMAKVTIFILASQPAVVEEFYQEQRANLARTGPDGSLAPLEYKDLDYLPLRHNVIKETLHLNSSIHPLMRKVKNPLPIPGTPHVIPTFHVLLASPGVTGLSDEYFPNAMSWGPHRWETQTLKEENEKDDVVDYGDSAMSKGICSPYLPFGAGRHRCIGEKFTYLKLAVIVVTMVRHVRLFTEEGKTGVCPTRTIRRCSRGP